MYVNCLLLFKIALIKKKKYLNKRISSSLKINSKVSTHEMH